MRLVKFCEENYLQYGDVQEKGTEVAMITDTICAGEMEREIIIDSDGFHIFELDCETQAENYLSVECSYTAAGLMVLALPDLEIFSFKLEEM